jgi:hypothetical protein
MTNLFVNPSFDDPLPLGSLIGWSPDAGVVVNNTFFVSAPASAQLPPFRAISQIVPTEIGITYNITVFAATEFPPASLEIYENGNLLDSFLVTSLVFEEFTTTFVATSTSTNILFRNASQETIIYIDNTSIFASVVPCYSGDSMIKCRNKLTKEISDIKAKDVLSTVHEVYNTKNNKFVPIVYNIVAGSTVKYMLIKKDSLGEAKPSADFYVTEGHTIVFNNEYIKAKNIPGATRVKVETQPVYSICINKSGPISINGLEVLAWSKNKWLDYAAKKNLVWKDNHSGL